MICWPGKCPQNITILSLRYRPLTGMPFIINNNIIINRRSVLYIKHNVHYIIHAVIKQWPATFEVRYLIIVIRIRCLRLLTKNLRFIILRHDIFKYFIIRLQSGITKFIRTLNLSLSAYVRV